MESSFPNLEQLRDEIKLLRTRLERLETTRSYLKLAKAPVLKLEPGDILAIKISRSLAESERRELLTSFTQMLKMSKIRDVQIAVVCSRDQVEFEILRDAS